MSLGSEATLPPGLNTPHTLAAARYESGLDNSPMYDGNDNPHGRLCWWKKGEGRWQVEGLSP